MASDACHRAAPALLTLGQGGGYLLGDSSPAGAPSGLMRRNGPAVLGRLPCTPGVYRFRDDRDRVLYIGRASVLRSRAASYWSDP